jgi:hypothetical protein
VGLIFSLPLKERRISSGRISLDMDIPLFRQQRPEVSSNIRQLPRSKAHDLSPQVRASNYIHSSFSRQRRHNSESRDRKASRVMVLSRHRIAYNQMAVAGEGLDLSIISSIFQQRDLDMRLASKTSAVGGFLPHSHAVPHRYAFVA